MVKLSRRKKGRGKKGEAKADTIHKRERGGKKLKCLEGSGHRG